jgi:hypothetical protein
VSGGSSGGEDIDWDLPTDDESYRANVQSISSVEDVVAQDRVETRYRVVLEPDADVTAVDRLRWNSKSLTVQGDVEDWRQGSPQSWHKLLIARHVAGG